MCIQWKQNRQKPPKTQNRSGLIQKRVQRESIDDFICLGIIYKQHPVPHKYKYINLEEFSIPGKITKKEVGKVSTKTYREKFFISK